MLPNFKPKKRPLSGCRHNFLAEVTQHIPNKGEHQIRYYGWYSNKKRGMQEKKGKSVAAPGHNEPDTAFRRKCRMTWAALIKCVYEVDPLKCPKCGGQMKIILVHRGRYGDREDSEALRFVEGTGAAPAAGREAAA